MALNLKLLLVARLVWKMLASEEKREMLEDLRMHWPDYKDRRIFKIMLLATSEFSESLNKQYRNLNNKLSPAHSLKMMRLDGCSRIVAITI